MAKPKRVFVCKECGATQARWLGKCPDCGTWDSLEEQTIDPSAASDPHATIAWAIAAPAAGLTGKGEAAKGQAFAAQSDDKLAHTGSRAMPLEECLHVASSVARLPTGISELDRVLGSSAAKDGKDASGSAVLAGSSTLMGLVPGSAVLVGGEPGIGKSTLLLQAARGWARANLRVLYVSSEESVEQVAQRASRLLTGESSEASEVSAPSMKDNLFLMHDTNLARILEQVRRVAPSVVIIDSMQMIYKGDVSAAPGSVTQLRRCATELVSLAKLSGIAVLLVGHVTKDGVVAGPRLLEHLVDCVLMFEGERTHGHRVVRAIKNRFGSSLEVGLFEMTSMGLAPAPDGGALLLQHAQHARIGSVLCPIVTGSRTLLVEVQALTATGFFGSAKRKSSGLDASRLAMLIAVLEQHAELRLADRDVFVSSVGGLKVIDPACDLALLLAIASSHMRKAVPPRFAACGEVGLGGEVRSIPQLGQRVREAARLGATDIAIPKKASEPVTPPKGVTLHRVATIGEAQGLLG
jgi:DNA repair protein RadA/Sms